MARNRVTNVAYGGNCPICGWVGEFESSLAPVRGPRDFRCGGCRSMVRFQDEACAILDEFEQGRLLSLDDLVDDPGFAGRSVFHIGHIGPIRKRLKRVSDYHESAYRPGEPLGSVLEGRPEFTNQDHQALTFDDESFDLIVSSHVLEHIPDWQAAMREAHRTLKPGGRYIFSIPGLRLDEQTLVRAEVVDGEVRHLHEPRHHNSPEGERVLVFTDFGRDIVDTMDAMGFVTSVRRPHRIIQQAANNYVVVAAKPT